MTASRHLADSDGATSAGHAMISDEETGSGAAGDDAPAADAPGSDVARTAGTRPDPGAPDARSRARARSAKDFLDRLDDRALPSADRMLAAAAGRLVAIRGRGDERLRQATARFAPAHGSSPGEGPTMILGAMRIAPGSPVERGARVVVLGLVALIVISAAAAMMQGVDWGQRSVPVTGPEDDGAGSAAAVEPTVTVGPIAGEPADDYAAVADAKLETLVGMAPDADLHAVVSLADYHRPEAIGEIFADYRIVEVFFGVPPDGPVVGAVIHDPSIDIMGAFAGEANVAAERARSATDPALVDHESRQAEQLRAGCACAFAAVVRAPARRLAELAESAAVRVVDPAPLGTNPPAVRFLPLGPDQV